MRLVGSMTLILWSQQAVPCEYFKKSGTFLEWLLDVDPLTQLSDVAPLPAAYNDILYCASSRRESVGSRRRTCPFRIYHQAAIGFWTRPRP